LPYANAIERANAWPKTYVEMNKLLEEAILIEQGDLNPAIKIQALGRSRSALPNPSGLSKNH